MYFAIPPNPLVTRPGRPDPQGENYWYRVVVVQATNTKLAPPDRGHNQSDTEYRLHYGAMKHMELSNTGYRLLMGL